MFSVCKLISNHSGLCTIYFHVSIHLHDCIMFKLIPILNSTICISKHDLEFAATHWFWLPITYTTKHDPWHWRSFRIVLGFGIHTPVQYQAVNTNIQAEPSSYEWSYVWNGTVHSSRRLRPLLPMSRHRTWPSFNQLLPLLLLHIWSKATTTTSSMHRKQSPIVLSIRFTACHLLSAIISHALYHGGPNSSHALNCRPGTEDLLNKWWAAPTLNHRATRSRPSYVSTREDG
jgi:hypothetical protein